MNIASHTFGNLQPMPVRCGSGEGNVSPELSWTGSPSGTKSFALVMEDPDAPGSSPFVHWVLFNIPPQVQEIGEGKTPQGAALGGNDAGKTGYFGPKPPSGIHHYNIRLYALDELLNLPTGASRDQLVHAMSGHELGMGQITGLFSAN